MYTHEYVLQYIYSYIHTYIHTHSYIYTIAQKRLEAVLSEREEYGYRWVCMNICILSMLDSIYIRIHTHTHTHTHTHIHSQMNE